MTRRNDLDGRGSLSEEALAEFTRLFLTTCLDQVTFMEGLMQPDSLRTRILLWTEEEIRLDRLPAKSGAILEAVLYRGELPRGDAAGIVGTGTARRGASFGADRERRTDLREQACATAACFPGGAGITLDASPVSGSAWLGGAAKKEENRRPPRIPGNQTVLRPISAGRTRKTGVRLHTNCLFANEVTLSPD
jgi:hypothetical protein